MRRPVPATEDLVLRLGAGLIGALCLASSVLAAELARQHMALLGTICGAGPHPHCGWCYGAASLVLVGLVAFLYAARPARGSGLLQIKAQLQSS